MTLDLQLRGENGIDKLTLIQHDANLTAIETEVNNKVNLDDARLTDARTPLAHTHATFADVTGLSAALDGKASTGALSALTTVVDSKCADDDARLTDARAIADGDRGFFTVTAGVAAPDNGVITNAHLADMASGTIKMRQTAGSGPPEDTATTIPAAITWQQWRAGTSFAAFATPAFMASLHAAQVWADATTLELDFGDGSPDLDTGKARSLRHQINTGASCTVTLKAITGVLVGRVIELLWVMDAAASVTVGLSASANGITGSNADNIVNPGIGASIGDWLRALVWLKSATEAVVIEYRRGDVSDQPNQTAATTGAVILNFKPANNECETTLTGNVTDVDPSALSLYGSGAWYVVIGATPHTINFAHSGFTFKVPSSAGWASKTFTPTANKEYTIGIRRKATTTYNVTMSEGLA